MATEQEEMWDKESAANRGVPKNDLEMIAGNLSPLSTFDLLRSETILTVLDDDGSYVQLDATDSAAMRLLEGSLGGQDVEEDVSLLDKLRLVRDSAVGQINKLVSVVLASESSSEPSALDFVNEQIRSTPLNESLEREYTIDDQLTSQRSRFPSLNSPQNFSVGGYEVTVSSSLLAQYVLDNPYQSIAYQVSSDLQNAFRVSSNSNYDQLISEKLERISEFIETGEFDNVVHQLDGNAGIVESDGLTVYIDEQGNLVLTDIILLDESDFSSHQELREAVIELADGAAQLIEFAYAHDNVEIGEFLFGSFDRETGETDLLTSTLEIEFEKENCDVALLFGEALFEALDPEIVDQFYSELVMMDWYVDTLIDRMPTLFPEESQSEWDPDAAYRLEMMDELGIEKGEMDDMFFPPEENLIVITDIGELDLSDSSDISQAIVENAEQPASVEVGIEVSAPNDEEVAALLAVV